MTIAELLVQTEATVFAALHPIVLIASPGFGTDELKREAFENAYSNAHDEAVRIVAGTYGEPCGEFLRTESENIAKGHPASHCAVCRWPLSQHGAKP